MSSHRSTYSKVGLKHRIGVSGALCLLFALGSITPSAFAEDSATGSEYRAAARLELATAYYTQHQYGASLVEINQALKLSPKYLQAYMLLGLVQMELQHTSEADSAFNAALVIDGRDGDTHNNYGWFLCQNNRIGEAFTHFDSASTNPMYQTPEKALYNAGRCARQYGDKPRAIKYFNAALHTQPRATAVMYELADMQYIEKNYQAVLDVLDRVDTVEGPNPKALWLALRTENRLGHQAEVASYGAQLLKRFPESPEAVLYRVKNLD